MKDSKYHTIDPLILQRLNLNGQRLKHILDILHGNQQQNFYKTQQKTINKSNSKNPSLASISQQESGLPPILLTARKNNPNSNNSLFFSPNKKFKVNTYREERLVNQSVNTNISPQRSQKIKANITRYERGPKSLRSMKHERSAQEDIINIEQQILELHQNKKQQLMKDYMSKKLKRSKSQQINPKDLYRLQVESIMAELTPIEQLEQAQHRMRKLKRRHRHLATFDKNYYIKLNQHDMLILF